MMVLGCTVAGGRFHGVWPGLKAEQLDEGIDLALARDQGRHMVSQLQAFRHPQNSRVINCDNRQRLIKRLSLMWHNHLSELDPIA
jgi:hypothetical protein